MRQRMAGRGPKAGAIAAAVLSASAAAAWAAGCKADPKAGGVMAEASVVRVEHGEVGTFKATPIAQDFVDPSPIVLWSGASPAAIVIYREEANELLGRAKQIFALTTGRGGPFPISESFSTRSETPGESFNLGQIHAVDLDGSGAEELVLVRESGAVEVHSLRKTLAKHELPATKLVHYAAVGSHRASAGGRDVLFLVFDREAERKADEARLASAGAGDRSVVLRVDGSGISRLQLDEPLRSSEVLAVGALSRPGSQAVDELLMLSARGKDVFLSRHRPDGKPLDAPRKVYVPISGAAPLSFAFLPGTAQAVVLGKDSVYFVEADKPANWIRAVDLKPLERHGGDLRLLGAMDAQAPKVVAQAGGELFAVDEEGTYFGPGLSPAKGLVPFLKPSPPAAGQRLIGVYAPDGGGEELLAVYSRKHGYRELSFDETMAAVDRFLPPLYVAKFRSELEPRLEGTDTGRDRLMAEEQKEKSVQERPKTVEEWKRLLPRSYEEVRKSNQRSVEVRAFGELEAGADPATRIGDYPDIEGLVSFVAGLELQAETTFELYRRGARVASSSVPGYLAPGGESRIDRRRVAFRGAGPGASAVLALVPRGDGRGERGQLHVVRIGEAR